MHVIVRAELTGCARLARCCGDGIFGGGGGGGGGECVEEGVDGVGVGGAEGAGDVHHASGHGSERLAGGGL